MVALIEDTGLLPEIHELLKNILYNESLSENAVRKITQFIERLDALLVPPLLPPHVPVKTGSIFQPNPAKDFDITSPEFIKEQRELSRQGTIWKGNDFVLESLNLLKNGQMNSNQVSGLKRQSEIKIKVSPKDDKDAIYERIDSCDEKSYNANKVSQIKSTIPIRSDIPPPVPKRKCRLTSNDRNAASPILDRHRSSNKDLVWVHDLQTPLYSGLLRNIRSNTKQWCVIKRHILYLFNDLNEPASFMADLHEYEVFKDPEEPLIFRVRRSGEPTVKLAAVDEKQYQLWLHAFRNAKFLVDSEDGRLDNAGELGDYSEFKDSGGFDEEDFSDAEPYEKPDEMIKKLNTKMVPKGYEDYEVMTSYDRAGIVGDGVADQVSYEEIGFPASSNSSKFNIDDTADYSAMPLPPLPNDIPPELPPRTSHLQVETNIYSDNDSLSSSFDSLSSEEIGFTSNQNSTDKQSKTKWEKEISFFYDLSAVFCGILHQRRMPAIWQKRYCKVKDQCLICYRSPDVAEPYLKIPLHGYQLDRAEETWKSFAFKMFKVNSDIYYFAAESRSELIKWISVLAKETNKDKFLPGTMERKRAMTDMKQVSCSEFNTSNESLSNTVSKKPITDLNSEFEQNSAEKEENNNVLKISKESSYEDHGVIMQGVLLRKLRNHWGRRWCCLKDESFFCYKDSTNDDLDVTIILKYATLTLLHNGDIGEVNCCFQLCTKEDQKIILSTITNNDWLEWINSLKRFVGSVCEEKFSCNASRLSRSYSHSLKDAIRNVELTDSDYPTCNESSTALFEQKVYNTSERSKTEIKDSIYCSLVIELRALKQTFQHIEYFMVLTKDKWLKFYSDITATIPTTQYKAINIKVIDENGTDPLILRLQDETKNKEITLKLNSTRECQNWKNAFLKVHYEQIDADDILIDKLKENYPKVVNKKINEPIHLSLSKSLSNKEWKKIKEQNGYSSFSLAKSLPSGSNGKRKSIDPILSYNTKSDKQSSNDPQKKTISEFIRSFTVDTLTRKNKNKSYVLNKEDVSLLKETYRGHLKQVIIKDTNETLEDRFCRISGKVFYCYRNDSDLKPLFKVPLKNAAIEEFSDIDSSLFRYQVTDLNLGKEYLFSLDSDSDLNLWVTALFGGDKLQDSHDSPSNSNKSLPSYNMYDSSRKLSLLSFSEGKNNVNDSNASTANTFSTQSSSINSLTDSNTFSGHNIKINSACDSCSSLISLGENALNMNPAPDVLPKIFIENIKLQGNFVEITKTSQDDRWLVLKDSILEVFSSAQDPQPVNIIQLSSYLITDKSDESLPINAICFQGENNSYVFVASNSETCETWTKELKATHNIHTQVVNNDQNNDLTASVVLRKKHPKLLKQASISTSNDDINPLTKYEKSEDPSTISGGLTELVPSSKQKWKKKNRYCRICQGFFYISKLTNTKKVIKSIDLSGVSVMDESDPAADRFVFRLDYLQDNKQSFALFQTSNQTLSDKWMVAVSMGILFHRLSRTIDRKSFKNEDTHEDFEFFDFSNPLSEEGVSEFEQSEQSKLSNETRKDLLKNEGALLESHSLVESSIFEKPLITVSLSDIVNQNIDSNDLLISKDTGEQKCNTENMKPEVEVSASTNINDNRSVQNNLLEENKFNDSNDNLNDLGELLDNIPEKIMLTRLSKISKESFVSRKVFRRAILKRQSTNLKKPPPKIKPKPIKLNVSKTPVTTTTTSVSGLSSPNLVALEKYKAQLENKRENLISCIKEMNIQVSNARVQSDCSSGKLSLNEKISLEELQRLRINLHQVEVELNTVYKNINRKVATNIQESDKTPSLQLRRTLNSKKNKESLYNSLTENDESKKDQPSDTQSVII